MQIQGIEFTKGDKFQVGEDSSIYTYINVEDHKLGFKVINAENEFDSTSTFRIDTMIANMLYIKKV